MKGCGGMNKFLKMLVAIIAFALFYIIFVLGGGYEDDPWKKLMEWAKR